MLREVREQKESSQRNTEKIGEEKRAQGRCLESFRIALMELDLLHKKAIISLKDIDRHLNKVKELSDSPSIVPTKKQKR